MLKKTQKKELIRFPRNENPCAFFEIAHYGTFSVRNAPFFLVFFRKFVSFQINFDATEYC